MDDQTRIELEAAAFRRLQKHLMEDRTDAQNIDMMNLAGFCRNCLSRWYQEAANERGTTLAASSSVPTTLEERTRRRKEDVARCQSIAGSWLAFSLAKAE